MMTNPIDTLRRTLAEVDAETRHEERKLHDLRTDGADHFRGQLADMLPGLQEDHLDEWSAQASSAHAVADQAGHQ